MNVLKAKNIFGPSDKEFVTEYEMRMNLASKTIEERDARIRELQIKLSDKSRDPRFNPPTQPKKSPQRSRSNQRSGGGSYKQSH